MKINEIGCRKVTYFFLDQMEYHASKAQLVGLIKSKKLPKFLRTASELFQNELISYKENAFFTAST
jgi:hypothetical protein